MTNIENLLYTEDHEWLKQKDDLCWVGVTDFAQKQLGDVVYVELPEVGETFDKGDEFGTIESVKAVSELYMPMGGEIIEINEALDDSPELLNEDSYNEGWLIKFRANNPEELEELLNFETYRETTS